MNASWDAAGLLEPLWGAVGGRDKLAKLTGIQPGTLSGYNTGRLKLGLQNAKKIAAALGVSTLELGAPLEEADELGRPLVRLLERVAGDVASLLLEVTELRGRVKSLETRLGRTQARPRRQGGKQG